MLIECLWAHLMYFWGPIVPPSLLIPNLIFQQHCQSITILTVDHFVFAFHLFFFHNRRARGAFVSGLAKVKRFGVSKAWSWLSRLSCTHNMLQNNMRLIYGRFIIVYLFCVENQIETNIIHFVGGFIWWQFRKKE